jgi:hypothetical protein
MPDAVESKLFGIGDEACTLGSHEVCLGHAIREGCTPCLDRGRFHPTESVADKLSAVVLKPVFADLLGLVRIGLDVTIRLVPSEVLKETLGAVWAERSARRAARGDGADGRARPRSGHGLGAQLTA